MKSSKKEIPAIDFLNGDNVLYLESLYLEDCATENDVLPTDWQAILDSLSPTETTSTTINTVTHPASNEHVHKQAQVSNLIMAYRAMGHLLGDIDPITEMPRGDTSVLELSRYELTEQDLNTEFYVGDMANRGRMTLKQILEFLRTTYCGSIGYEFDYMTSIEQRNWLYDQVERKQSDYYLNDQDRVEIMHRLVAAEGLERYLHTKYVGQKRFSLEGGDVLIPMMSELIQRFGNKSIKEIVIGMAHRGRLNVLVNILGKSPKELFGDFEGVYNIEDGDTQTGDVKYHEGVSSDIATKGGNVHVALAFNPSHLEIIGPVVEGSVRARQERWHDKERDQVIPIIIHGDAAFAGQGVVMETFNMALTLGYATGGTIHIIINNQIGFTTNTLDARSTLYCTEVAKLVQSPILHVNGDDPDAVLYATRIAIEYRLKFKRDVVLDIVCYRRHGHNEADEPSITQPIMYSKIKAHKTTREIYAAKLTANGVMNEQQISDIIEQYRDRLDKGLVVAGQIIDPNKILRMVDWTPYMSDDWSENVDTSIPQDQLIACAELLTQAPKDFVVHRGVKRLLQNRIAMARGEQPMDWGCAELLAYATLLQQGYKVRLSGQDSGRGTFSHRHATLHDQSQRRIHVPLQYLTDNQSDFIVTNTLLSEEAVLAFEYGYSTSEPTALVIWEGQFGDFVNGAQVVIDQFISSGEAKWSRKSNLVMFLPHGLEGQGPEHSSARIERFLQLCAGHNMQVCIPTTPAQMFHVLRRQMLRSFRRPLVLMTPKSLLRHKLSVSQPQDLFAGGFLPVIEEIDPIAPEAVARIIICSGKVYYDLLEKRREKNQQNVAIIRLEQVQPFPKEKLQQLIQQYPSAMQVVWCQEESQNQGCWYQIRHYLESILAPTQKSLMYVGRKGSPSPAVGHYQLHVLQQQQLVEQALHI